MIKTYSLLLALSFCSVFGFAQDLHFSQVTQSPLLINPGSTGIMEGSFRAGVIHKNQSMGGNYRNTLASIDFNLLKDRDFSNGYLGMGALFYSDAAGDGNYGKQSGSISFSGAIPMGRTGKHTLSLGLQAGFANSNINRQNLKFESQWNGETYNENLLSSEAIVPSYSYADVSTGLYYSIDGSQSSFSGTSNTKFNLGVSLYHANKPKLKYIAGSTEQLSRKLIVHADYINEIPGSKILISLDAAQFFQGKQSETIFGGLIGYKLKEARGDQTTSLLGFGLHMRTFESIIPSVMLKLQSFRFEMSYDATVSHFRKTPSSGSLELSLVYTTFDKGLFKGGKIR